MDESLILHLEQQARVSMFAAEPWRRVLWEAADLIEERGHCKGEAMKGDAFCLSGAISRASLDMFANEGSVWALYNGHEEAISHMRVDLDCPVNWNDAPERTAAEVIAKLREVACS